MVSDSPVAHKEPRQGSLLILVEPPSRPLPGDRRSDRRYIAAAVARTSGTYAATPKTGSPNTRQAPAKPKLNLRCYRGLAAFSGIVMMDEVAEREGFEPPVELPPRRISSAVHSTTLPPLRLLGRAWSKRGVCSGMLRSRQAVSASKSLPHRATRLTLFSPCRIARLLRRGLSAPFAFSSTGPDWIKRQAGHVPSLVSEHRKEKKCSQSSKPAASSIVSSQTTS